MVPVAFFHLPSNNTSITSTHDSEMRLLTLAAVVIIVLAQICSEVEAASKDYYKILGVPKDAGERQIKKAYYKLAQQWHPDKARSDEQRKLHHEKYTDIVKAYETLSDADKRKKYDMFGDEEQQQAQGGFKMDPRFSGFGFGSGAQDIKINFGSGGFNFGGFNFGDLFGGAKPRANQQHTKQQQQYTQKTTKSGNTGSSRKNCHTQRTCNGGLCETRTVCQ